MSVNVEMDEVVSVESGHARRERDIQGVTEFLADVQECRAGPRGTI
jgi:hypothetical protein